jgi:Flp pilus assembly protein TadD
MNLAEALKDQGRREEAVAEYRNCLRLMPDDAQCHTCLGVVLQDLGSVEEAIAEYREAIRLRPNLAAAHNDLGLALLGRKKLEEAIDEFRIALRLEPDLAEARNNLGRALMELGKFDQATVELRNARRLKADLVEAQNNLFDALMRQGKVDEAISDVRKALQIRPELPDAHYHLGLAFRSRGEFAKAVAELRKARDLGRNNLEFAKDVEQELETAERQASQVARLPAVLASNYKPADADETLGFAEICYLTRLHGSSARLWAEAFQSQPKLLDDMETQHRYNAACAAVLAGCGQGKDIPPLDEETKSRWRKQAIDWLKADLAHWTKEAESKKPEAKALVSQTLQHWKTDPDLGGIRDKAAPAKLSEAEQRACRALWAEVDAVLAKARSATK